MTGAASRDGYGAALLDLAEDDRVVVLEADLGKSTKSCLFRAEHPQRAFSMGIAEQNMMLVAAGLASTGLIPFASTFAIFTERGFEQVRNGIARPGLVAHICGSHGGIHTGTDGSSAQSIEDLGIYRTLPNMTVMHPCDASSTRALTKALVNYSSPSYTRTVRNKTREIYTDDEAANLEIGRFSVLTEGSDVAILACGVMVQEALDAADTLAGEGVHATVVDVHTLKPFDHDEMKRISENCGAVVTAEDHSIIGGLGGAVAESLTANHPAPLERVGVEDTYGMSGQPAELMEHYGLTANDIVDAAKTAIARRNV
ncbi:MAG: 1-deoxy-D-xylulose-5-phosphate synthase [Methanobacteriota archaeon]|nr:transketolase [Euryarchaeota archaeon]CAI8221974.1 MAG: 1-deoxy-D-xylulose-5-phosphate synthase [Euryarchaeota archaeon]